MPRKSVPIPAPTPDPASPAPARKSLSDALASFAAARSKPRPDPLPVKTRVFRAKEKLKSLDRRRLRKLIRPENALVLVDHLPESADDRTHALIAGDFVFCDLLTAIVAKLGAPAAIHLATLSLSQKNVAALERLATQICPVHILLSDYFEKTNQQIFAAVTAAIARQPRFTSHSAQSHCKVALFDYPDRPLVIEGSANLRSCGKLEQLSIFADPDLFAFHLEWMDEAVAAAQRV